MSGKRSSSSWSSPAGSRGLAGFAQALRAAWPRVLLRLLGWLVAVSLLWVLVAPVYASGLALIGRALLPVLAAAPDTQYTVAGGRVLARWTLWLPKEQRRVQVVLVLWHPAEHYGVPLLAALVLATPALSWRRRGQALAGGLGLLTLTQIAAVLVTTTQQHAVMGPDGVLQLAGSPLMQHLSRALFDFFAIMGRGFFALLIYHGLLALGWNTPTIPAVPPGQPVSRHALCPCGSGRQAQCCCQA